MSQSGLSEYIGAVDRTIRSVMNGWQDATEQNESLKKELVQYRNGKQVDHNAKDKAAMAASMKIMEDAGRRSADFAKRNQALR